MVGPTIQTISIPFAVATASGAGLLSLLSWRVFRDAALGRIVGALALIMGVTTVYHVLLIGFPDSTMVALLGGGKYLAVALILGFALKLQRRTAIPIREYDPSLLTVVGGTLLFVGGGLTAELFVPSAVHWVHGFGTLLIVVGFYQFATAESSSGRWFDVAVRNPYSVRPRERWMRPLDDHILELCSASDLVLTPAVIAYNIEYSREEVNRRLSELERHSLVERVDRGKYRITQYGQQYLSGSL